MWAAYGTSGRPSRISCRLCRARSGSRKPVARSAVRLGRRRPRRGRRSQQGMVAAVEESEGLDDELELAIPAATELDVRRLATLGLDHPVDLRLHVADRRHDLRVEPGTVGGLARERSVARADG